MWNRMTPIFSALFFLSLYMFLVSKKRVKHKDTVQTNPNTHAWNSSLRSSFHQSCIFTKKKARLQESSLWLLCVYSEIGPGYVAEASLEFAQSALKIQILLPQSLKGLGFRVCGSSPGLFLPFLWQLLLPSLFPDTSANFSTDRWAENRDQPSGLGVGWAYSSSSVNQEVAVRTLPNSGVPEEEETDGRL